jgi:Transposase DDE domain
LLAPLAKQFRRLRLIWADGAYAGELETWTRGLRKWGKVRLETVRKPKGKKGFAVLPWRWRVERTFAWALPESATPLRLRTLTADNGSTHLRCHDPPDDTSARRLVSLFKLPLTLRPKPLAGYCVSDGLPSIAFMGPHIKVIIRSKIIDQQWDPPQIVLQMVDTHVENGPFPDDHAARSSALATSCPGMLAKTTPPARLRRG